MTLALAPEFAFIERFFRPLAGSGSLDLQDDAAVLAPCPGQELVLAADAMVEGVHFLPHDPPIDLGRKLLRVNLSDLAAMGADPLGYLLTLCVPPTHGASFFEAFTEGLARDQSEFGLALLGGDTTATSGPLSMSLTIVGSVPAGSAIRRSGARPDDILWVTGTIGDGALGLLALQGKLSDPDGHLADRYHLPRPRLGIASRGVVNAAIDVSDGLLQDAAHLCRASGLALDIHLARVPLSPQARAAGSSLTERGVIETCLSGGDDYELLLAAPEHAGPALRAVAQARSCLLTPIGVFRQGSPSLRILDMSGVELTFERHGFSHF